MFISTERDQLHPVAFAAQRHKRFVFIHPYKAGNGRIARLIMNTALIQDGFLLAVIPPVLRQEYIELLKKAHRDDKPFEQFIAERVIESQKEVMRLLHMPIPNNGCQNNVAIKKQTAVLVEILNLIVCFFSTNIMHCKSISKDIEYK